MHKSGGSLTQSSLLLIGPGMSQGHVRQIINLTQTTSGSYLLMSSLDISRRNLALRGRETFEKVMEMAEYARNEINEIPGFYAFSREMINGDSVYDFDVTKLSVHTLDVGLAGIEVYDLLRDEYDIQIEFGDFGNILAYLSIGDRMLFMPRRNLCLLRRQQGESAVNLLCAIPPAFPFWRRESALQKRLWSIYSMPWKKDVPLPGRRIRRLPD